MKSSTMKRFNMKQRICVFGVSGVCGILLCLGVFGVTNAWGEWNVRRVVITGISPNPSGEFYQLYIDNVPHKVNDKILYFKPVIDSSTQKSNLVFYHLAPDKGIVQISSHDVPAFPQMITPNDIIQQISSNDAPSSSAAGAAASAPKKPVKGYLSAKRAKPENEESKEKPASALLPNDLAQQQKPLSVPPIAAGGSHQPNESGLIPEVPEPQPLVPFGAAGAPPSPPPAPPPPSAVGQQPASASAQSNPHSLPAHPLPQTQPQNLPNQTLSSKAPPPLPPPLPLPPLLSQPASANNHPTLTPPPADNSRRQSHSDVEKHEDAKDSWQIVDQEDEASGNENISQSEQAPETVDSDIDEETIETRTKKRTKKGYGSSDSVEIFANENQNSHDTIPNSSLIQRGKQWLGRLTSCFSSSDCKTDQKKPNTKKKTKNSGAGNVAATKEETNDSDVDATESDYEKDLNADKAQIAASSDSNNTFKRYVKFVKNANQTFKDLQMLQHGTKLMNKQHAKASRLSMALNRIPIFDHAASLEMASIWDKNVNHNAEKQSQALTYYQNALLMAVQAHSQADVEKTLFKVYGELANAAEGPNHGPKSLGTICAAVGDEKPNNKAKANFHCVQAFHNRLKEYLDQDGLKNAQHKPIEKIRKKLEMRSRKWLETVTPENFSKNPTQTALHIADARSRFMQDYSKYLPYLVKYLKKTHPNTHSSQPNNNILEPEIVEIVKKTANETVSPAQACPADDSKVTDALTKLAREAAAKIKENKNKEIHNSQ